jgi:hypothetical protein
MARRLSLKELQQEGRNYGLALQGEFQAQIAPFGNAIPEELVDRLNDEVCAKVEACVNILLADGASEREVKRWRRGFRDGMDEVARAHIASLQDGMLA